MAEDFSPTKPLRILHVGCGAMSKAWLKPATQRTDAEVVGLVDLNAEAARSRAGEFGLEGAYAGDNLEQALAELRPDIVFDCTVPQAHKSVTLAALAAGCHVLGEKPISENLDDAREMVRAAAQAGRTYAVIQNRRYLPAIRTVRASLASGAIGPVHTVDADFYVGPHFGGFREVMEHVLLADMAIHTFDQFRYAAGTEATHVFCREFNPPGTWYRHGASAVAVFDLAGGGVFTYRGSWCAQGRPTSWEARWRFVGEKGTLTWEDDDIRIERVEEGAATGFVHPVRTVEPERVEWPKDLSGHAGIIDEFLDCVRTGAVPLTVAEDNFKSLAMVFGAIASAESGRVETLPVL